MVLTALTLTIALIHVGLGAGVVLVTYGLLEKSFTAAVPAGFTAGVLVIVSDWIVGKAILGHLYTMTWTVVEQLVVSAAVGAMVGLVGFSLLFQPERPDEEEEVATW